MKDKIEAFLIVTAWLVAMFGLFVSLLRIDAWINYPTFAAQTSRNVSVHEYMWLSSEERAAIIIAYPVEVKP